MALAKIQLMHGSWEYDDAKPLGRRGGFGAVFLGQSADGRPVAIKRLHLDPLVQFSREIEIAKYLLGHNHPHVTGILDVGRDPAADRIFIVMERAQQSLQDLIDAGPVALTDALEIIDTIVAGLEEIGEIVHRDLKPDNVLLHNGVWKLTDLGLARFIEDTTAPNTVRGFCSVQYSAPEQFRMERPTKATDVYALGAILYALLTGEPPFDGPSQDDYSHQHQYDQPKRLKAPPLIQQLGFDCLAKNPPNRPTLPNLRARIQQARISLGVATPSSLSSAAAKIAEQRARKEAEVLMAKKVDGDREATAKEAMYGLQSSFTELLNQIKGEAPGVNVNPNTLRSVDMELGRATLEFKFVTMPSAKTARGKWDVLAAAYIEVMIKYTLPLIMGRSANLLFGKLCNDEGYRWWEVSLLPMPNASNWLVDHRGRCSERLLPFGLVNKNYSEEEPVVARLLGENFRLAENPIPVDGEMQAAFHARWKNWFGEAAAFEPHPRANSQDPKTHVTPFHPPLPVVRIDPKFFPNPGYDARYPEIVSQDRRDEFPKWWQAIFEWFRS